MSNEKTIELCEEIKDTLCVLKNDHGMYYLMANDKNIDLMNTCIKSLKKDYEFETKTSNRQIKYMMIGFGVMLVCMCVFVTWFLPWVMQ